jgi:hypothetical protein
MTNRRNFLKKMAVFSTLSLGGCGWQLAKQGIFILGGKKEKKSDLLLIKLQKYHYFLSFKIC